MRLYVFILSLILACVFAFNMRMDVSGLDTYREVFQLAQRQQPDDLLVWERVFDQRAWVKAKLSASQCPELLVLGSSTVGHFTEDMFDARKVLNAWMTAPTIEDLEALTMVLSHTGCTPKTIVLGVDPWLVNTSFGDKRWMSLSSDFVEYQRKYGSLYHAVPVLTHRWQVFKERLNFTSTYESANTAWRLWSSTMSATRPRLMHESAPEFCARISSPLYIRAYDGHYVACPSLALPADRVDQIAKQYVDSNTNGIRDWREVDQDLVRRLTVVLRNWRGHGSAVVLLTPSFHPNAYAALRTNARIAANLDALDERLDALAHELNLRFANLRDPAKAGCVSADFEDGHHAGPSCIQKLANILVR